MVHRIAAGLAFLALTCGASPFAAQASDACILFEHADYGGAAITLYGGQRLVAVDNDFQTTTTTYDGAWNDDISSFRTTGSCRITVWEDVNEGGASWSSSKSYKYIGDDWNDEISEAYCSCR